MTSLRVIDTIQIASPCDADWGEMTGNNRVRHCGACEKNVYNLSAMTEGQIHRLIVATQGDFCGRLYRRADGTMLTADCPVGLKAKLKRAARRTWLIAAAFISSLLAGGGVFAYKSMTTATMGEVEPMPMGAIAVDEFEMGEIEAPEVEPLQEVKGEIAIPEPEHIMGKIAAPRR